MSTNGAGLTALVVDDELPALADLGYLLGRDERVAQVITASSGTEALQVLDGGDAKTAGIGTIRAERFKATYDMMVAAKLLDASKVDVTKTYTTQFVRDLKILP